MADTARISDLARQVPLVGGQRAIAFATGGARFGFTWLTRHLGLGGLSDRQLGRIMDVPLLEAEPADHMAMTLEAQVQALCLNASTREGLYHLIGAWDRQRATLPDGQRRARLAATILLRRLRAPRRGFGTSGGGQAAASLQLFEAQHDAAPDDPIAASLAAMAHLAVAQHRAATPGPQVDDAHLTRAQDLLDRFDPAEFALPLLAEAHYRLALWQPGPVERLQATHDDWADLDPSDLALWEQHSPNLLARSRDARTVAVAAARCEWRTERWLGSGGYALFLLPVLAGDRSLWDRIDPERMAAAALELARRHRRQQLRVNRIAARLDDLARIAPGEHRGLIRTVRRQVLEECLRAIAPAAWGASASQVRRRIADAFLPELRSGACLRATAAGLCLCDASAP